MSLDLKMQQRQKMGFSGHQKQVQSRVSLEDKGVCKGPRSARSC